MDKSGMRTQAKWQRAVKWLGNGIPAGLCHAAPNIFSVIQDYPVGNKQKHNKTANGMAEPIRGVFHKSFIGPSQAAAMVFSAREAKGCHTGFIAG